MLLVFSFPLNSSKSIAQETICIDKLCLCCLPLVSCHDDLFSGIDAEEWGKFLHTKNKVGFAAHDL